MAIADHALTDASGRHHTCFLLPLDRSALPSMESLMDALDQSSYEVYLLLVECMQEIIFISRFNLNSVGKSSGSSNQSQWILLLVRIPFPVRNESLRSSSCQILGHDKRLCRGKMVPSETDCFS